MGFSFFSGLILKLTIVGFQGRVVGGNFMEELGFMVRGGGLSSMLQLLMLQLTSTLLTRYLSNVVDLSYCLDHFWFLLLSFLFKHML